MNNTYYNLIRDEFLEPAGLINKELTKNCRLMHCDTGEECDVVFGTSNGAGVIIKGSLMHIKQEALDMEQWIILGHDYDLREVMQWFHTLDYALRTGGMLLPLTGAGGSCLLDLSKPLKDQDLKGLYELMKEVSKS